MVALFQRPVRSLLLALGLTGLLPAAFGQGRNCEHLRDEIAAKFRAGGMPQVDLRIVAADGPSAGRVVGQCAQGSKRIVHVPGSTPARAEEALLTECRDGTVSVGGSCGRKP